MDFLGQRLLSICPLDKDSILLFNNNGFSSHPNTNLCTTCLVHYAHPQSIVLELPLSTPPRSRAQGRLQGISERGPLLKTLLDHYAPFNVCILDMLRFSPPQHHMRLEAGGSAESSPCTPGSGKPTCRAACQPQAAWAVGGHWCGTFQPHDETRGAPKSR